MKALDNYECEGQMTLAELFPDLWYGRTCPEHSVQTEVKTLEWYSKRFAESKIKMPQYLCLRGGGGQQAVVSWEMDIQWLGEYTMHSFGECPRDENESHLSQILEANAHPKYYLSARACQGILRRAESRGKTLPPMLEYALRKQANVSTDGMYNQNISNPKTEQQNPCMQENVDMAVESPTLCSQSAFKNEQESQGGGKGILIQNDRTGALSTLNNQPVCYGISAYDSNAMKSANPNSGIYKADATRTLDNNGGNPACNQGGMIVLEGNGSRPSHRGDGYKESDVSFTLNSTEVHGVCWDGSQIAPTLTANNAGGAQRMPDKDNFNAVITYGLDRASFNQGKNAQYDFSIQEELAQTIVAKGPGAVMAKR